LRQTARVAKLLRDLVEHAGHHPPAMPIVFSRRRPPEHDHGRDSPPPGAEIPGGDVRAGNAREMGVDVGRTGAPPAIRRVAAREELVPGKPLRAAHFAGEARIVVVSGETSGSVSGGIGHLVTLVAQAAGSADEGLNPRQDGVQWEISPDTSTVEG
jgi:hypothetical protein